MTTLERRWLKAILADKRVKLFRIKATAFDEIEPLFNESDIYICGQYSCGDDYTSEEYIKIFQKILRALREKFCLKIEYITAHKNAFEGVVMPQELQYSMKEDKFRLFAVCDGEMHSYNLSRIKSCQLAGKMDGEFSPVKLEQSFVEVAMNNERHALERSLLRFQIIVEKQWK